MKKTISILIMLVLLLGVSLSAGAKEEPKIDTEELRSVLTLNMYQAQKVTAQNYLDFPMSAEFFGPKDILLREVIGLGIITGKEPVVSVDDLDPKKYPHAPRFTADLVRDVFESAIGGYGTFDCFFRNTKQIADNRGRILIQEPDGGYVYLVADAGSGGDAGGVTYTALIDTEIVGDTVYLYEVFGEYVEAGDRFTLFGTFSLDSKIKTGQIASGLRGDGEVGKRLLNGVYDEYLPVYKHTYKANKYGGYYWESTERFSPAKEIPLSLLPAGSVSCKDLLDLVPCGAYAGPKTTLNTVKDIPLGPNPEDILFRALEAAGLIDRSPATATESDKLEDNPKAARIPVAKVTEIFDQAFGAGAFAAYVTSSDRIAGAASDLLIKDGSDYVYLNYDFGGGDTVTTRYVGSISCEVDNGVVTVTTVAAAVSERSSSYSIVGTFLPDDKNAFASGSGGVTVDGASVTDRVLRGVYDRYLPVYKHTFKENGAGGYYWVSTERIAPAKEIPLSLLPAGSVSNPSTSDGAPVGFSVAALLCLGLAALTVARKRKS